MTTKQVIKTIKNRRKKLGWSQARLAMKIGVTRQHWTQVELGTYSPSIDLTLKAIEALNMEIVIFVKEESSNEQKNG